MLISSASSKLSFSALLYTKGIHKLLLSQRCASSVPSIKAQALQLVCLKLRASVEHIASSSLQLQFIFIQSQMVTAILLDKAKCGCSV